jgi:hypothetical protein
MTLNMAVPVFCAGLILDGVDFFNDFIKRRGHRLMDGFRFVAFPLTRLCAICV